MWGLGTNGNRMTINCCRRMWKTWPCISFRMWRLVRPPRYDDNIHHRPHTRKACIYHLHTHTLSTSLRIRKMAQCTGDHNQIELKTAVLLPFKPNEVISNIRVDISAISLRLRVARSEIDVEWNGHHHQSNIHRSSVTLLFFFFISSSCPI